MVQMLAGAGAGEIPRGNDRMVVKCIFNLDLRCAHEGTKYTIED